MDPGQVLTLTRCKFCPRKFAGPQWSTKHANKCHLDLIATEWQPCDLCNLYQPDENTLLIHKEKDHSQNSSCSSSQSQDEVTSNSDCQISFSAPQSLISKCEPTTAKQILPLACNLCQQTFHKLVTLQIHVKLHHPDLASELPHKCLLCKQAFATKSKLQCHISMIHKSDKTKQKPSSDSKCSFCPLNFSKRTQYVLHANAAHKDRITGWKLCEPCSTYFPSLKLLSHHKCSSIVTLENSIVASEKSEIATTEHLAIDNGTEEEPTDDIITTDNGTADEPTDHIMTTDNGTEDEATDLPFLHHSIKIEEEPVPQSETVSIGKSCQFCLKELTTTRGLLRHYNSIHKDTVKDSWPKCHHCQIYFPSVKVLEKHNITAHQMIGENYKGIFNKGRVVCEFCPITLIRPGEYYKHANKIHFQEIKDIWITCTEICKKYFPNMMTLSKHKCSTYPQVKLPNPYHFCPLCPQKFSQKRFYIEHANKTHLDAFQELGWLLCSVCSTHFPEVDTLNRHKCSNYIPTAIIKQATPKAKPLKRPKRKGTNPNSLLKPREVKKPQLEFQADCPTCAKTLNNLNELELHLPSCQASFNSFCGVAESQVWIKTENPEDGANLVDPLEISAPPVKFNYQQQNNETDIDTIPSKLLDCSPIPVTVRKPARKVVKSSSGVRICQFCQKRLSTPRCFLRHVNTFHIDLIQDSWHFCPQCKTYFPTDKALQDHNNSAHSVIGEKYTGIFYTKKVACHFCSKSFVRASEYYKHANNVHSKNIASIWKTCSSICHKHFPSEEALDRHNCSTYVSSKLASCDFCHETVTAAAIYDHANKFHKDCITQKWLQCYVCSKHFPSEVVLSRHMAKSHKTTLLSPKMK